MKRVAVLGGGPAGAFAAEHLAGAGFRTVVVDEKLAWEKPCGGGLTYKAYQRYPFLKEGPAAKKVVTGTLLSAEGGGATALRLEQPVLIYSRVELNRMLLDRAAGAGAELVKSRVSAMERAGSGWRLRTKAGNIDADFCVVATGARNAFRDAGTEFSADDAMMALGYYVPGEQDGIDIQFLPGLEGYIWVFPRCGHMSVGICGKGEPSASLRKRLEDYMEKRGFPIAGSKFYGHLLPCLREQAWRTNRVAGDGWLAVGDAAGTVDPITGEGLYYALRSAELAADAIVHGTDYPALLRDDFAKDLETGARMAERIYRGRFLFGPVPARMVQFARRSDTFRGVIQDLFAGTQPYGGLKRRLLENWKRIAWETVT